MEFIGIMILKIVVAIVALYVIAGFTVSLKVSRPGLAIVTSLVSAVISFFAYKNDSLRWIPIFLSLLAFIFYAGEGYMDVKVHENVYKLVSVERRWTSIFAENDTYELHFAPLETGGFLVNTFVFGLFFSIVYSSAWGIPSGGWAYAIPIYIICMSIMDILYFNGISLADFFRKPVQILVYILIVYVGFVGLPFSDPPPLRTEKLYNQCSEVAVIDYSKTYKIEYVIKTKEGNDYVVSDGFNFLYDSSIETGAYYTVKDNNIVYSSIVYKDSNSNNLLQYSNRDSQISDFEFEKYATVAGGPFKYITIDKPFDTYMTFDRNIFFGATQVVNNDNILAFYYSRDLSENSYYNIYYSFKRDDKGKPISVSYVECSIKEGDKVYQIGYTPLSTKTNLSELFNEYKTIHYGLLYNKSEEYEIDFSQTIAFLSQEDIITNFDFTLKETYNGVSSMYVYDSSREMVGLYSTNYSNSFNAINNNDFVNYSPDYYILNDYECMMNFNNGSTSYPEGEFKKYTYDNEFATEVIKTSFLAFYDIMSDDVFVEGKDTILKFICKHLDISDNKFVEYKLYYKNTGGEYEIYKIELNTTYENREYSLTMYYDDVFDLM